MTTMRIAALPRIAILLLFAALAVESYAEPGNHPDDAYLNRLQGTWDMSGTFGDMPVKYHARGDRVLHGAFLRRHMIDAERHPQYEADVFIGFDAQNRDFIAHWLDRFGAAGARVVGTGKREGLRLVMMFPYTTGAFRDTFVFIPDQDAWSLLLESKNGDGSWSRFASYSLTRPK